MSIDDESRTSNEIVYEVTDLAVSFKSGNDWTEVVHGVSFGVMAGEVVALVGESGSGKSVSSLAGLGLLGRNARVTGSVKFKGRELIGAPEETIRKVRGNQIALIFQEPMTALHPVYTIGQQLVRVLRSRAAHTPTSAKARALELLTMVELPDPQRAYDSYPHQLSGGQRQRALIALCISCDPSMLIADEPTTALDVTVQAEILELLRRLRKRMNGAAVLITHDLGIVADTADHVVVMQDGHVVEHGRVVDVFERPQHPYTKQLLAAVPRLRVGETLAPPAPQQAEPLLRLDQAVIEYQVRGRGAFRAVDEVSFDIGKGEIVGLVGESGSGKTSIAKAIIGLEKFKSGSVKMGGTEIVGVGAQDLQRLRRRIGFVFQDPGSSLNPRRTVGDSVSEPLRLAGGLTRPQITDRVREALDSVYLPADALSRYPYQLSGGQRQRVGIARAIITRPELLIADEPTSALDVSVQQRVLEILEELQADFGFACLFVSHDLAVIDRLSDRIVVLRRGKLVESGTPDAVIRNPKDPYTQRLVQAIPVPDPVVQRERRLARLAGQLAEQGQQPAA
ncbi:dipeptide ABC transporter ATP-binding protein [Glaciibacter sp. 2TAF33]|uniref:dipeptide ABC transporter ATP-binding protein n=1 Tax=Glaciibacter sp. 2TAF33 TaxID=3233015 RepID=UPI003F8FF639